MQAIQAKPSPAGERAGSSGFTLIELLVVLAIMGLLLTAIPALLSAGRPGAELRDSAHRLADDLRATRDLAINGNGETALTLDLDRQVYRGTANAAEKQLPSHVHVAFQGPEGAAKGKTAQIHFFPDGSSSGGTIRLSSGEQAREIVVHWLSGRVSVDD